MSQQITIVIADLSEEEIICPVLLESSLRIYSKYGRFIKKFH